MAAVASTSRVQASDLNGAVERAPSPGFAGDGPRERRASPSYDASARQQQDFQQSRPSNDWRRLTPERALGPSYGGSDRQDSGRPSRNYHGGRGANQYGGSGGADFFASRRAERDASTVSIWPPSPRTPRNDDDSEDERSRKKRKKDRKHKSSSSRSHKKKRYSSETDTDSEDERERRRRKREKRDKKHSSSRRQRDSRSRSRTPDRIHADQEDQWAEKGVSSKSADRNGLPESRLSAATAPADVSSLTLSNGKSKERDVGQSESDDDDVGPKPLAEVLDKADHREYGGALLRGEGEAMAAYVADGARIPRRGEIGLESSQIEKFEDAGYVMSGSRHRRMNAVRMRKENQVISAEEKRAMLKTQKDEQNKKEALVVGSFKELLEKRLQGERQKVKNPDF